MAPTSLRAQRGKSVRRRGVKLDRGRAGLEEYVAAFVSGSDDAKAQRESLDKAESGAEWGAERTTPDAIRLRGRRRSTKVEYAVPRRAREDGGDATDQPRTSSAVLDAVRAPSRRKPGPAFRPPPPSRWPSRCHQLFSLRDTWSALCGRAGHARFNSRDVSTDVSGAGATWRRPDGGLGTSAEVRRACVRRFRGVERQGMVDGSTSFRRTGPRPPRRGLGAGVVGAPEAGPLWRDLRGRWGPPDPYKTSRQVRAAWQPSADMWLSISANMALDRRAGRLYRPPRRRRAPGGRPVPDRGLGSGAPVPSPSWSRSS